MSSLNTFSSEEIWSLKSSDLCEKTLPLVSTQFEGWSASLILSWSANVFADSIVLSSSFQTQSVPLLHLVSRICPQVPILFLDTGFHFQETLDFRDSLSTSLGLSVKNLGLLGGEERKQSLGPELYRKNPGMCCYLNKVEPLKRELLDYHAWVTGIRRDQTNQRRETQILSRDENGLLKICPMAKWESRSVERYREHFQLPGHPLETKGYRSIGCQPCTKPTTGGQDPRAGRWSESEKTECGIHL